MADYIPELAKANPDHFGFAVATAHGRLYQFGDADNWSPISMADDLASSIPGCVAKQVLAGQSHYSCLYQAVPYILAAEVGVYY